MDLKFNKIAYTLAHMWVWCVCVCLCVCVCERERESATETETETKTERQRQIGRQRDREGCARYMHVNVPCMNVVIDMPGPWKVRR